MDKNIISLLEEKLKVKFNGKTGLDLQEYLKSNGSILHEDFNSLMGDSCSFPDKFYLSMEAKCGHLLDTEFKYDDVIPFDDNEYSCVVDMVTAGDYMPMVSGFLYDNKDANGFFELVSKVHKLCKENNARALLEFVTPYEEDIDIAVEFNSDKIKYDGIIYIIDDNGEALLQSYLWIAYRLNGGNLDKYLSLFKIKYKKES